MQQEEDSRCKCHWLIRSQGDPNEVHDGFAMDSGDVLPGNYENISLCTGERGSPPLCGAKSVETHDT